MEAAGGTVSPATVSGKGHGPRGSSRPPCGLLGFLVVPMMILLVASLWGGAGLCGKGGSRQVYEFSDTEAGCTATVRIEGSHVRIRNTVVDADPVNCDVVVEYEGSHMTASSAATSDCGSGEGSGSGGFLWGPSTERAFATGCGADEVVTLTR